MLALLLATTLRFTLPTLDAAPGQCGPSEYPVPLSDLRSVQLWLSDGVDTIRSLHHDVIGREGRRDSFVVQLAGTWQAWVTVSDLAQPVPNQSCASNVVMVTGSAPLSAAGVVAPRVDTYDLAGRKASGTLKSGIYFRRELRPDSTRVRRIVVIR